MMNKRKAFRVIIKDEDMKPHDSTLALFEGFKSMLKEELKKAGKYDSVKTIEDLREFCKSTSSSTIPKKI
jgi:hypothetical protein